MGKMAKVFFEKGYHDRFDVKPDSVVFRTVAPTVFFNLWQNITENPSPTFYTILTSFMPTILTGPQKQQNS